MWEGSGRRLGQSRGPTLSFMSQNGAREHELYNKWPVRSQRQKAGGEMRKKQAWCDAVESQKVCGMWDGEVFVQVHPPQTFFLLERAENVLGGL